MKPDAVRLLIPGCKLVAKMGLGFPKLRPLVCFYVGWRPGKQSPYVAVKLSLFAPEEIIDAEVYGQILKDAGPNAWAPRSVPCSVIKLHPHEIKRALQAMLTGEADEHETAVLMAMEVDRT